MRSFSTLSLIATLACAVFTSAAPIEAAAAAAPSAAVEVQRRCDGCDLIKGVIGSIQVEVDAVESLTGEITVEVLYGHVSNVIGIVQHVTEEIKADASVLVGITVADVVKLLCDLLTLVGGLVSTVTALLGKITGDVKSVYSLLDILLCAVGDLLCLILSVVGKLLGDVVGTVTDILNGIGALPAISAVLYLFGDVTAHYPIQLGGLLSVQGILSLVGSIAGPLLKTLGL